MRANHICGEIPKQKRCRQLSIMGAILIGMRWIRVCVYGFLNIYMLMDYAF